MACGGNGLAKGERAWPKEKGPGQRRKGLAKGFEEAEQTFELLALFIWNGLFVG